MSLCPESRRKQLQLVFDFLQHLFDFMHRTLRQTNKVRKIYGFQWNMLYTCGLNSLCFSWSLVNHHCLIKIASWGTSHFHTTWDSMVLILRSDSPMKSPHDLPNQHFDGEVLQIRCQQGRLLVQGRILRLAPRDIWKWGAVAKPNDAIGLSLTYRRRR